MKKSSISYELQLYFQIMSNQIRLLFDETLMDGDMPVKSWVFFVDNELKSFHSTIVISNIPFWGRGAESDFFNFKREENNGIWQFDKKWW